MIPMRRYRRSSDMPALGVWLIVFIAVCFALMFWLRPDGLM